MSAFARQAAVPARAGIGFKLPHTEAILAAPERVGFVEIHAENFMSAGGPPHHMLARVRDLLPVSLHGVGLSIGAEGPLDRAHLARLAEVARRYEPGLVSEHLAWSTHAGAYFNDLLPLPYNAATLARVVAHIDEVQEALGRPMLLENPSSYLAFDASTMDEIEFIRRVVAATGCGLILDVNNVFVSASNLGFSAGEYVAAFPLEAVGEIHLAGHAVDGEGAPAGSGHGGPDGLGRGAGEAGGGRVGRGGAADGEAGGERIGQGYGVPNGETGSVPGGRGYGAPNGEMGSAPIGRGYGAPNGEAGGAAFRQRHNGEAGGGPIGQGYGAPNGDLHGASGERHGGPLLIDAHDREVAPPVWALYADVVARIGRPVPTLIEWDNAVPDFATLAAEAARADRTMGEALAGDA